MKYVDLRLQSDNAICYKILKLTYSYIRLNDTIPIYTCTCIIPNMSYNLNVQLMHSIYAGHKAEHSIRCVSFSFDISCMIKLFLYCYICTYKEHGFTYNMYISNINRTNPRNMWNSNFVWFEREDSSQIAYFVINTQEHIILYSLYYWHKLKETRVGLIKTYGELQFLFCILE